MRQQISSSLTLAATFRRLLGRTLSPEHRAGWERRQNVVPVEVERRRGIERRGRISLGLPSFHN